VIINGTNVGILIPVGEETGSVIEITVGEDCPRLFGADASEVREHPYMVATTKKAIVVIDHSR